MPSLILLLIARAAHLIAEARAMSFDAAVRDLVETLKPELPAKPDGTPYTVEDVQLAAAVAREPWQRVLDRAEDDGA